MKRRLETGVLERLTLLSFYLVWCCTQQSSGYSILLPHHQTSCEPQLFVCLVNRSHSTDCSKGESDYPYQKMVCWILYGRLKLRNFCTGTWANFSSFKPALNAKSSLIAFIVQGCCNAHRVLGKHTNCLEKSSIIN